MVDDQLLTETDPLRRSFEKAELRDKANDAPIKKIAEGIEKEIKSKNAPSGVDPHRDAIYLNYIEDSGKIDEGEIDRLQELLTLHSDALRNTTQIGVVDKRRFIENNVNSYVALMWLTLASLRELFHTASEEDLLKLFFRGKADASTKEKFRLIVSLSQRIVAHAVPVSIILFMVDHLGSPKLSRSFRILGEKSPSPTAKLFYALLLFSQSPAEGFVQLKEIVGPKSSQSEDFIIVQFLRFYCKENVLPNALLDKVVALISDVYRKYSRERLKDEPYLRTGTLTTDLKTELKKRPE